MLLGAFAGIAVLLASIGVYGVIAYSVGQRTREFGIRLALGARRSEIVRVVMQRGVVLFGAGALIGLVAAAASARVLATLLFHVSAFDIASFAAVTLILFAVAVAACGLPRAARRASIRRSRCASSSRPTSRRRKTDTRVATRLQSTCASRIGNFRAESTIRQRCSAPTV